jgi:hypothetical protein
MRPDTHPGTDSAGGWRFPKPLYEPDVRGMQAR